MKLNSFVLLQKDLTNKKNNSKEKQCEKNEKLKISTDPYRAIHLFVVLRENVGNSAKESNHNMFVCREN